MTTRTMTTLPDEPYDMAEVEAGITWAAGFFGILTTLGTALDDGQRLLVQEVAARLDQLTRELGHPDDPARAVDS